MIVKQSLHEILNCVKQQRRSQVRVYLIYLNYPGEIAA